MEGKDKCFECGRASYIFYPYLRQNLCRKHFQRLLMKRVNGILASNGIRGGIKPSKDNRLGRRFLSFMSKRGRTITPVSSNTLEDFALAVGLYFLFDRIPKIRIKEGNAFSPLYTTSEDEIISFFKSKGREPRPLKRNKEEEYVLDFLRGLEGRRPGGMISLVKMGIRLKII